MYQSKQYYEYKNFRLVGKKKVVKINKLHQYFIFDLSKNNNKNILIVIRNILIFNNKNNFILSINFN